MPTYIERAYIMLKSNQLTPEQMTAALGIEPTSTRNWVEDPGKHGAMRPYLYTWTLESSSDSDWVGDHVQNLAPVIKVLAEGDLPGEVMRSFNCYGFARGQGYVFGMGPDDVALLDAAKCGTWIDVWGTPPGEAPEIAPSPKAAVPPALHTLDSGTVIRVPGYDDYSHIADLVTPGYRVTPTDGGAIDVPHLSVEPEDHWGYWLIAVDTNDDIVGYMHSSLAKLVRRPLNFARVTDYSVEPGRDAEAIEAAFVEQLYRWARKVDAHSIVLSPDMHVPYGAGEVRELREIVLPT